MKKSIFQFKNPHIEKVSFEINNNIPCEDDIPININVQTLLSNEENIALVKLILTVGELDTKSKELKNSIYFNGCIVSEFKWEREIKNIENMLKVNGGAVLLSYLRPILSSLTMQAGIKPLHIPLIDFTK